MKKIKYFLFLLPPFMPFRTNAQLMRSPEIDNENRVTFYVRAPKAREVKVINLSDTMAMGAREYLLAPGEDDVWQITTLSCRPGFHYYELSIDGFRCSDPSSQMYFGWGKWSSGLEVPNNNLDFYLPQDVPRGVIRYQEYQSSVTGTYRKCLIYIPSGYDLDKTAKYPVLFLQHGAGENELAWTMQGKINIILENLIASGKAQPMIVVMDNGYAARPGSENPQRPAPADNVFEDLVVKELIPMIDRNYRTLKGRESRAIAGFSMGAVQALIIGLKHPELFASIGAFSGGGWNFNARTSFNGGFQDPGKINAAYRLIWIGCGEQDNGYQGMKNFHETLDSLGINNVWYEGPGSHEWQVWRKHIYEFSQLVFK
ncbi:MAG TPA: alpha/beta hydrolase-fold protein [Cyclobacteriaceae bacterium]|nr:alpha/beta hydrolase-fold protein [Cyclobacteriaceae bacterium]